MHERHVEQQTEAQRVVVETVDLILESCGSCVQFVVLLVVQFTSPGSDSWLILRRSSAPAEAAPGDSALAFALATPAQAEGTTTGNLSTTTKDADNLAPSGMECTAELPIVPPFRMRCQIIAQKAYM